MHMVVKYSWLLKLMTWVKMTPTMNQVVTMYGKSEKVKVRNMGNAENLLQKIVACGPSELQVVTDFDATLTRSHINGKKCDSSYGIIAFSPLVPEKITNDARELFDKYYPIELNVSMTAEEKAPYMEEWYEKSHESFLSSHPSLNKSQIIEMARSGVTMLRENADKMLLALHSANIPTLILSAGMGNLVEEFLKVNSVAFSNVKIMANFMEFDESDELKGFSDPVVHVYNKNEVALHKQNSWYFEDLKCRHNVLLLGDSLGDANMAIGVNANAILKIGFLNDQIESRLPSYMDAYDIVLLNDQSMDFINVILSLVMPPPNKV